MNEPHRNLLDAVLSADAEKAKQACREHMLAELRALRQPQLPDDPAYQTRKQLSLQQGLQELRQRQTPRRWRTAAAITAAAAALAIVLLLHPGQLAPPRLAIVQTATPKSVDELVIRPDVASRLTADPSACIDCALTISVQPELVLCSTRDWTALQLDLPNDLSLQSISATELAGLMKDTPHILVLDEHGSHLLLLAERKPR